MSPTIVATPTTPLGQGVLVGEDGRRLVARAREMQYNAGVLKTFDEVREIRGGGGVGGGEMQYNASVIEAFDQARGGEGGDMQFTGRVLKTFDQMCV